MVLLIQHCFFVLSGLGWARLDIQGFTWLTQGPSSERPQLYHACGYPTVVISGSYDHYGVMPGIPLDYLFSESLPHTKISGYQFTILHNQTRELCHQDSSHSLLLFFRTNIRPRNMAIKQVKATCSCMHFLAKITFYTFSTSYAHRSKYFQHQNWQKKSASKYETMFFFDFIVVFLSAKIAQGKPSISRFIFWYLVPKGR